MKALALLALLAAGTAVAQPGYDDLAPQSTVRTCVDQIAEQANFEDAGRVRHEVESRVRRVSGHTLMIDTLVFDESGERLIRAYATKCAVARNNNTQLFTIRAKDVR